MSKIRLGIVGCGGIVSRSHSVGLGRDEDIIEITAVCDISEERLNNAIAQFGNKPKGYTDYREMLDDIDAVSIALPHDLHYEVGMFFAENGKHILMEKPLCNTEEECVRLINECDKHKKILMCEYPVRFDPGVLKLKEVVNSGKYGKPYHMSIWTEQFTDGRFTPWIRSSRIGGGQLFSHGCHYVDILLMFMGDPLSATHFGTNIGTPWMIREGTSTLSVKFKSGATAMHFGTWGAKGSKMNYDYQVFMDSGVMLNFEKKTDEVRCYYNTDFLHIESTYQADDKDTYTVLWKADQRTKKNLDQVYREFVTCITEEREPITSGRRALESLKVIWRVYNAEENNKIADLSDITAYDHTIED